MDKLYIANDEVIVSALEQIKESKNVNAFKIVKKDKKYCYCAILTDGTEVQLTKGKKLLDFIWNPMLFLEKFFGYFYMQDFIMCEKCNTCINKNNIHNVVVDENAQSEKQYRFYMIFNNGQTISSYIYKKKAEMQKEYDSLKNTITNLDMCLDK